MEHILQWSAAQLVHARRPVRSDGLQLNTPETSSTGSVADLHYLLGTVLTGNTATVRRLLGLLWAQTAALPREQSASARALPRRLASRAAATPLALHSKPAVSQAEQL